MGNNIVLQCLGAAETVTGSKHLLRTPEKNILIDCGLFQGIKAIRQQNWNTLPIDIKQIDLILLTHAHLDHCGFIPALVKAGFNGKILATPPTRDLAEIILNDSARIQEEDAEHANKYGYTSHKPALPLYTVDDVANAMTYFETHNDREWITISPNIKFRYLKNGHILGSCFIEMDCFGKKVVFSGDIGRTYSELFDAPTVVEEADYLVMESTYGDRLHKGIPAKTELAEVINECVHRKGNLLIPSFAVGRAQEIMYMLCELKKEKRIPDVPVYLDTPMGISATVMLDKYPQWHKLKPGISAELYRDVNFVSDEHGTQKVLKKKHSKIVIAASGMLNGGRVLQYLNEYVGEHQNIILLVGYQAEGTRGRELKEGVHEIKIYGKYRKVKAAIREITSLSAHADQGEMMDWLKKFRKKPGTIFLVHGEPMAQEVFSTKIKDELHIEVRIPKQNEEIVLG